MSCFASHVFKFIHFKLNESPLLGDVALLVARELDLGPVEGLSHVLLVLQRGVDGRYDLAYVGVDHCALGLSRGTLDTSLEPRLGTASSPECPLERAVSRVPSGNACRQPAAHAAGEAAACRHRTPGLHAEKNSVGLTGCKQDGKAFYGTHVSPTLTFKKNLQFLSLLQCKVSFPVPYFHTFPIKA